MAAAIAVVERLGLLADEAQKFANFAVLFAEFLTAAVANVAERLHLQAEPAAHALDAAPLEQVVLRFVVANVAAEELATVGALHRAPVDVVRAAGAQLPGVDYVAPVLCFSGKVALIRVVIFKIVHVVKIAYFQIEKLQRNVSLYHTETLLLVSRLVRIYTFRSKLF